LPYRKVALDINNIDGYFTTTVTDYRWLHARVDGGPDRRYKHNYQMPVKRKATLPVRQYGVMTLKIGRDAFVVLTNGNSLLPNVDTVFHNWISGQP
jgi:hypothetical protein